MKLKQSQLAKICNVSRSAINQAIKKQTIPESLDTDNPVVMQFILSHGGSVSDLSSPRSPRNGEEQIKPNKLKTIRDKQNQIKSSQAETYEDSPGRPAGMSDQDWLDLNMKSVYEARDKKMSAELKAIKTDQQHGLLGERVIFDSMLMELFHAIQVSFIDPAPTLAVSICQRLGTIGQESIVEDIIDEDNASRLSAIQTKITHFLRDKITTTLEEEDDEED